MQHIGASDHDLGAILPRGWGDVGHRCNGLLGPCSCSGHPGTRLGQQKNVNRDTNLTSTDIDQLDLVVAGRGNVGHLDGAKCDPIDAIATTEEPCARDYDPGADLAGSRHQLTDSSDGEVLECIIACGVRSSRIGHEPDGSSPAGRPVRRYHHNGSIGATHDGFDGNSSECDLVDRASAHEQVGA